jgi:hypothetical protein
MKGVSSTVDCLLPSVIVTDVPGSNSPKVRRGMWSLFIGYRKCYRECLQDMTKIASRCHVSASVISLASWHDPTNVAAVA